MRSAILECLLVCHKNSKFFALVLLLKGLIKCLIAGEALCHPLRSVDFP